MADCPGWTFERSHLHPGSSLAPDAVEVDKKTLRKISLACCWCGRFLSRSPCSKARPSTCCNWEVLHDSNTEQLIIIERHCFKDRRLQGCGSLTLSEAHDAQGDPSPALDMADSGQTALNFVPTIFRRGPNYLSSKLMILHKEGKRKLCSVYLM